MKIFYILLFISFFASAKDYDFKRTLSLQEMVGQVFILGISGKSLSKRNIAKIRKLKPGGIILFGVNIRNYKQVLKLNQKIYDLYEELELPMPFIAVDQEGGVVTRIKTYPKLPSALAVGRANDLGLTYELGKGTGKLLSSLGIHMNLAPVLDVSNANHSDFIGTRSYGSNSKIVSDHAREFCMGMKTYNILCTAKHFPGHGGISTDSHDSLPKVHYSMQELMSQSLIPFRNLVLDETIDAVMVGHIAFPHIEKSSTPATYSKTLVSKILRENLKFEGIVVTDDIEMAGANVDNNPFVRTRKALDAGADFIMIAWNSKSQYKAVRSLYKLAKQSKAYRDRINKSYKRLMRLKKRYQLLKPKKLNIRLAKEAFFNKEFKDLILSLNKRNLGSSIQSLKEKLILESFPKILVMSSDKRFQKGFEKVFTKNKMRSFLISERRPSSDFSVDNSLIVYHISGPKTANAIHYIPPENRLNTIVINSSRPSYLKDSSLYLNAINTFDNYPMLGYHLASILQKFLVSYFTIESKPQYGTVPIFQ